MEAYQIIPIIRGLYHASAFGFASSKVFLNERPKIKHFVCVYLALEDVSAKKFQLIGIRPNMETLI